MTKKTIWLALVGIALATLQGTASPEKTIEERLAALESEAAQPHWPEQIKLKGDLRYRYEYKAKDGDTDKNRHRIRARLGAYADVNAQVKAGIRIATGSDENPTSTNQDLDDFSSKKSIWLDLAFFTYSPHAIDGLGLTFGKMKQPWEQVSDLIFDSDVNPEGINASYQIECRGVTFMSQLGYHIMTEETAKDLALTSGQLAATASLEKDIKLTFGVAALVYNDLKGSTPPTFGTKMATKGNSTDLAGDYRYDFQIIDGFAKLDIKGPTPIKVYAEYLNNIASNVSADTAWLVGLGTTYKKAGFDYTYRDMDADSVLGALADGDFGGPGGKGHRIKATYSIAKNYTLGTTYLRMKDIADADIDLLQIDFSVKF